MNKIKILIGILLIGMSSYAQKQENSISEHLFKNPLPENRPLTWMHVMGGNMSKVGMTKDLEAIADAGIGGIILFNVTHRIPNGPVDFNSPEYIEITEHAAAECERLGLSFGIHNCDGWTSSGGPWVPVEHSMKQVVHREVIVNGGNVKMFLPSPSKIEGFYKEIAVLAYPALASEIIDSENPTIITSSNKDFDINIATNGKIDERTELRVPKDGKAWIQWNFGKPLTVQSFLLKTQRQRYKVPQLLQSSNDGINFKDEFVIKMSRHGKYEYTIDKTFKGITAQYFRFVTDVPLDIAEISLTNTARYDNMISRTNIHRANNGGLPKLEAVDASKVIKKSEILNLTKYVDDKGVLKTILPKGNWTIMRVGYTTTGALNDPASVAGTGWEVDKFSRESFKIFYDGHVRKVIDATSKIAPNALQYVEIDSYEVGGQNWTKDYELQFKAEHGYDIINFLPLYAGRYVDNADTTERVLWDIRNFNSKLMCENYFDYATELIHADGLKSYVEPYGNGPFNTLDAARSFDIPMGEFHASGKSMTGVAVSAGHIYGRNIISAEAFTSGPNVNFEGHPGFFKEFGDKGWAAGINEIVFHRFAHQANTKVKPGMGMSGFGSHIDRTQTWWDNAGKSWFKYLARGQYLLRQGVPVSDVLAFVGDGSPSTTASRKGVRNLPNHINYDGVNADVLLNRISVENGQLVLPEGTRYRVLYLGNQKEMRLATLKRIAELANKGVVIIGNKPGKIGGYLVSEKDEIEFSKLLEQVWSKPTTSTNYNWNDIYKRYNIPVDLKIKGGEQINYAHRTSANEDIYFFFNPEKEKRTYECTFNVEGKIPEFWNPMDGSITKLVGFEHSNGKTKVAITLPSQGSGFVVFRESSASINSITTASVIDNPELSFKLNSAGKAEIEASKNGAYAIFYADGKQQKLEVKNLLEPIVIKGDWEVTFPDLKAGVQSFTFPKLIDWTSHNFEGIKYYSGTAIYQKTFKVDKKRLTSNNKFILDLGKVYEIARVILNGKDLGVLWKAPHTIDITSVLKAGKNNLKIEVTNQWTNRLIGDENFPNVSGYNLQPHLKTPLLIKDPQLSLINRNKMVDWYTNNEPAPLGQRSTFTTYPFYKRGDELLPAGLVGPVVLKVSRIIEK